MMAFAQAKNVRRSFFADPRASQVSVWGSGMSFREHEGWGACARPARSTRVFDFLTKYRGISASKGGGTHHRSVGGDRWGTYIVGGLFGMVFVVGALLQPADAPAPQKGPVADTYPGVITAGSVGE